MKCGRLLRRHKEGSYNELRSYRLHLHLKSEDLLSMQETQHLPVSQFTDACSWLSLRVTGRPCKPNASPKNPVPAPKRTAARHQSCNVF